MRERGGSRKNFLVTTLVENLPKVEVKRNSASVKGGTLKRGLFSHISSSQLRVRIKINAK